jgi:hypothetical protein
VAERLFIHLTVDDRVLAMAEKFLLATAGVLQ